jgi:hypothetical protein
MVLLLLFSLACSNDDSVICCSAIATFDIDAFAVTTAGMGNDDKSSSADKMIDITE